MENLDEMNEFLYTYFFLKLNHIHSIKNCVKSEAFVSFIVEFCQFASHFALVYCWVHLFVIVLSSCSFEPFINVEDSSFSLVTCFAFKSVWLNVCRAALILFWLLFAGSICFCTFICNQFPSSYQRKYPSSLSHLQLICI